MTGNGATVVSMITVGIIRNGATYLSQHLRKNDYWAEGEKQIRGEWIGQAAVRLGLEGAVTDKPFDALRLNKDWRTGKRLTARENRKTRMAFFDIQISAPKDVSVLAMVGGDERVRCVFRESVETILGEMERFAAVRERRGEARDTEAFRLTGNFVGGMFMHDASRDLDPQLHVHAVIANATWDAERSQWMALQHAEMLRASPYLRQAFYRELAGRLRQLGYEPYEMTPTGFSIRGVEHLRERFSKRAREVKVLAEEFAVKKGRRATKREIEVLVRESRGKKLAEITTPEVRARQRAELMPEEAQRLDTLVRQKMQETPRKEITVSPAEAMRVVDAAIRHIFERRSVAREGEVLSAALELHPKISDWREVRLALKAHPDALRANGEMTLRSIRREEAATIHRVQAGRNTRVRLGTVDRLPEKLTRGQRHAAKQLLRSRDFLSLLVGDAGTGKTTVLSAIEDAHVAAGGLRFLALAPTTRARDALAESGFNEADTVQRFVIDESLHVKAAGRVLLIDEAGLLSTHQLERLTAIAELQRARLLLVGDTKQHYSVQRGDALRHIVQHTHTPVVRLAEVLRQREEPDRRLSRLLASGEVVEALLYAERQGIIQEAGDDEALFAAAAEHYARNVAEQVETLVVIPIWEEIERFNGHARRALRSRGLLGNVEVVREAVKPLAWTEEQKQHWNQYQVGDRLLFARDTRSFRRGTAGEVVEVLPDGLRVRGERERVAVISRKQRGTFEVGRAERLAIAAGDRLLIRGRDPAHGFANGDMTQVAWVNPATDEVVLTDGRHLPADFKAWTYGHALTAYRSQGSTAEESLLVLGESATRSLGRRQFYVANTRYRGAHRIYVANKREIFARLQEPDAGRELAAEFVERQRINMRELMSFRRLPRMLENLRLAIMATVRERRRVRHVMGQRMGV
jgi:conjugative relaxase-like TrwC/TraI family protein